MTDHVNVAVSEMCSWAVYHLPAFPQLLCDQTILKFSIYFNNMLFRLKKSQVGRRTQVQVLLLLMQNTVQVVDLFIIQK